MGREGGGGDETTRSQRGTCSQDPKGRKTLRAANATFHFPEWSSVSCPIASLAREREGLLLGVQEQGEGVGLREGGDVVEGVEVVFEDAGVVGEEVAEVAAAARRASTRGGGGAGGEGRGGRREGLLEGAAARTLQDGAARGQRRGRLDGEVVDPEAVEEGDVARVAVLQDVRQGADVVDGELERGDLGHGGGGAAAADVGQHAPERLEGVVDLLHAVALAGVRRLAPVLGQRRRPDAGRLAARAGEVVATLLQLQPADDGARPQPVLLRDPGGGLPLAATAAAAVAIAVAVVVVVVGAHGYLCRLTGRQALHLFIFVNHIFAENGPQNVAQITTYAHVEITSVPFAPEIPSRL